MRKKIKPTTSTQGEGRSSLCIESPAAYSWETAKLTLRQSGLTLKAFKTWLAAAQNPIVELENGDLEVGVWAEDVNKFIAMNLQWGKDRG